MPITPASLIEYIAKKSESIESDEPFKHAALEIVPFQRSGQISLVVQVASGDIAVLPYIRLTGVLVEGMTLTATFGDITLTIFRPEQPEGEDEEGLHLMGALVLAFQDHTLRRLKQVPDQVEVKWAVKKKKGEG